MTKMDELLIADAVNHQINEAERQGYHAGADNYRSAWQRLKSIITLIIDVRKAQRVYFSTRTSESLQEAKRLEAQLDRQISEMNGSPVKQGTLFDTTPDAARM